MLSSPIMTPVPGCSAGRPPWTQPGFAGSRTPAARRPHTKYTRTHTHARTRTHTTHTQTRTPTRTRTHARTRTHTHAHARRHANTHARARAVLGLVVIACVGATLSSPLNGFLAGSSRLGSGTAMMSDAPSPPSPPSSPARLPVYAALPRRRRTVTEQGPLSRRQPSLIIRSVAVSHH